MTAILPEAEQEDLPTGFSIAGHVGEWRAIRKVFSRPR